MEPLSVNTPPTNGGQGPVTPVRLISGRKLHRRGKNSPSHRALLAVDLVSGTVQVSRFTRAQARVLTGASYGYVNTAAKLNPEQRQKVERGQLSLAAFHNKRQPSDAALLQYIEKVGADRVMAALDRYTEPQFPLVAAE
jgi:hypothetical protein